MGSNTIIIILYIASLIAIISLGFVVYDIIYSFKKKNKKINKF